MTNTQPSGYLRVATACPPVTVADVPANTAAVRECYLAAVAEHCAVVVTPELSLTGYSLGDLVLRRGLRAAALDALAALAADTATHATILVVGLPLAQLDAIYNVAAVLAGGRVIGLVPKTHLPTYGEFYEKRWYQSWLGADTTINIAGESVPFGTGLVFVVGDCRFGVEICEDLWVNHAPSQRLVDNGVQVVLNPSASPELVGKAAYRRDLVRMHSARIVAGYVYAGCDWTESTMDVVMSGHQLIASQGVILAERLPFATEQRITTADIDLEQITNDRVRDTNHAVATNATVRETGVVPPVSAPRPRVVAHPFLPHTEDTTQRHERLSQILDIQAHGLAQRIRASRAPHLHLGLSGGLDSTLAFVVATRTAAIIGRPVGDVLRCYTMPAAASSERTQSNAVALAQAFGVPCTVIPIGGLVAAELQALGHDGVTQDVTYENVQARLRTTILFNSANRWGGLVLGTGDLSEIALGWCTFNGDHMSHYHVNAGIPKTLVRHLVTHMAAVYPADVQALLADIVATPISPELTTNHSGEVSQRTEDIIGPYELHDFFLYHLVRWGDAPPKIVALATQAFAGVYPQATIEHWLGIFLRRFTVSQFKRSVMPDGPKVGSVALSPRGDWRMPSDLRNPAVWQWPEGVS
jgi:NAD+ synthase (glutamine-hydrolysing)